MPASLKRGAWVRQSLVQRRGFVKVWSSERYTCFLVLVEQVAKQLNDDSISRPWSKYSKGSSGFEKSSTTADTGTHGSANTSSGRCVPDANRCQARASFAPEPVPNRELRPDCPWCLLPALRLQARGRVEGELYGSINDIEAEGVRFFCHILFLVPVRGSPQQSSREECGTDTAEYDLINF